MIKDKKVKLNETIETCKDYVEGRINIYKFIELYNEKPYIKILIEKKLKRFSKNPLNMQSVDLERITSRDTLFRSIVKFLEIQKVNFIINNTDSKILYIYENACPIWLYSNFYNGMEYLLSLMPSIEDVEQCMVEYKNILLNTFVYDDYPPDWFQDPEWPLKNGKPMIFKGQSGFTDDATVFEILYYFYDSDTLEEVIIEQYT